MIRHSKPMVNKNELAKLSDILISGNHTTKETVKKFEKKLSCFIGVKEGIAINSGTSALHIALLCLNIKKIDEIIIPSFVCTALLNAINYIGAKPILADIDSDTFNISYSSVLKKMTKRTKAIIIPHMFGLPINIKPFLKLGIFVIEDCAQSLGAKIDNHMTGSQGQISIFSFYATKLISTGYGGMLVSSSEEILKNARDLLDVDEKDNYKLRYNYNMTDFQAALGISQLSRLDEFIKKRKEIASSYNNRFNQSLIRLPIEKNNIYYRYIICVDKNIDSIISTFNTRGIEIKKPVFKPLHQYLNLNKKYFPATEDAFKKCISLPIYPSLEERERKKIEDILCSCI